MVLHGQARFGRAACLVGRAPHLRPRWTHTRSGPREDMLTSSHKPAADCAPALQRVWRGEPHVRGRRRAHDPAHARGRICRGPLTPRLDACWCTADLAPAPQRVWRGGPHVRGGDGRAHDPAHARGRICRGPAAQGVDTPRPGGHPGGRPAAPAGLAHVHGPRAQRRPRRRGPPTPLPPRSSSTLQRGMAAMLWSGCCRMPAAVSLLTRAACIAGLDAGKRGPALRACCTMS